MYLASVTVVVQDTKEPACLRLFLDYQGLPLLWSWMVDVPSGAVDFKTQVQWLVCVLMIHRSNQLCFSS